MMPVNAKTAQNARKLAAGGNVPEITQNGVSTAKSQKSRRFYVIRRDSNDWTPIIALISGPLSPALSTMRTRFEALYHKPPRPKNAATNSYILAEYTYAMMDYERNLREMGYAGDSVTEWFIDWLLKTDERFERVDFQEVNL